MVHTFTGTFISSRVLEEKRASFNISARPFALF